MDDYNIYPLAIIITPGPDLTPHYGQRLCSELYDAAVGSRVAGLQVPIFDLPYGGYHSPRGRKATTGVACCGGSANDIERIKQCNSG